MNAYDVFDDNVITSNRNSFACSIAYRVTWLPCPFIINKCWLLRDIPPRTNLLKKNKSFFKQENKSSMFFLHYHASTWFIKFNVVIL